MLILSSADLYYADYFPNYSSRWITGPLCKAAAVLSTLSSEASVGFVCLIALDRYLGIAYPFGIHRGLGKTRLRISVIVCWFLCCMISLGPIVLDKYIPGIFYLSEVCVGLPIVKREIQSDIADFISRTEFKYNIKEGVYFFLRSDRSYISSDSEDYILHYQRPERSNTTINIPFEYARVSSYLVASYLSIVIFIWIN